MSRSDRWAYSGPESFSDRKRKGLKDHAPNRNYVWGWGAKVNAMNSRLRRRKFKRITEKEIEDQR